MHPSHPTAERSTLCVSVLACAILLAPSHADAQRFAHLLPVGIEDFETWDLGAEELDDEYGLDFYFSSFDPAWERAWAESDEGARLSLGCVTRERWEMVTEVMLHRDISRWARFHYVFAQEQRLSLDKTQQVFAFEMDARGTWLGAFARPQVQKELHDFGLVARRRWGDAYDVALSVSFENALNNFWTERSFLEDRRRVEYLGGARILRLDAGHHRQAEGATAGGGLSPRLERTYLRIVGLPEFERRVEPAASSAQQALQRLLGGNEARLGSTRELGPVDVALDAYRKESRLADFVSTGNEATDVRRLAWFLRGRAVHPLVERWKLAWGIQVRRNREQDVGLAPYRLVVREFLISAGAARPLTSWLGFEAGYTHMDVDVSQDAAPGAGRFTFGSRNEGRFYLAGAFEFGSVRLRLVETLEVDGESYDVVGVHDKGFIQLQAAF